MKIYHTVSIDLAQNDACVNVPAISGTEGDCGTHVLQMRLLQNGKAWPVPDDASAVISYARLDGTGGTYDTLPDGEPAWSVKDGLVYVELAPACFAVATKPWEEIWLTVTLLRGDSQVTTQRIPIMVQRSLVGDGEESGVYVSFASVVRQYIGDTTQLNTENTGSIVDAINEALERCETTVVSVKTLRVSEDHELLVTLTNGRVLNAGRVLVPGSVGGVSTVCGIAPNEDGDVPITANNVLALSIGGGSMEGSINMDDSRIVGLGDPVDPGDAVSKGWLDRRLSKRNLLDNWYFKNAVNQRGASTYLSPGPVFDRWNLFGSVEAGLSETGLSLYCQAGSNGVMQYLADHASLDGQTVTISALLTENEGDFVMELVHVRSGVQTVLAHAETHGTGLVSATCTVPAGSVVWYDNIFVSIGSNSSRVRFFHVAAVKLELGNQQTLVREEDRQWVICELPDFATELFRCQRFLQVFRTQSLRPTYAVDYRPPMRADPALSTLSIGGVTHYIASAEL